MGVLLLREGNNWPGGRCAWRQQLLLPAAHARRALRTRKKRVLRPLPSLLAYAVPLRLTDSKSAAARDLRVLVLRTTLVCYLAFALLEDFGAYSTV